MKLKILPTYLNCKNVPLEVLKLSTVSTSLAGKIVPIKWDEEDYLETSPFQCFQSIYQADSYFALFDECSVMILGLRC